MAILILDQTDFKSKIVSKVKGHYTLVKGSIHQEDVAIINIYAPNNRAPYYMTESNEEIVQK